MKRFIAQPLALTLVLPLLVTLGTSGCSWAFSRPPRHTPQRLCQPNYASPVFDTIEAVGGGVLTLMMLAEASGSDADTMGLLAAITGGTTAAFGASAHYGFKQARACREQRAEIARNGSMWIAPFPAPEPTPDSWPPEVEQHVDVDENQIDIHTTIRRAQPRQ